MKQFDHLSPVMTSGSGGLGLLCTTILFFSRAVFPCLLHTAYLSTDDDEMTGEQ
jgi:hypothetical protein